MNQNLKLTNLTSGVVSLSKIHNILPREFIDLTPAEVSNFIKKIREYIRLGWVSASYVDVEHELRMEEKSLDTLKDYIRPTSEEQQVIQSYEASFAENPPSVTLKKEGKDEASPLIKRYKKRIEKQEKGVNDSKRVI